MNARAELEMVLARHQAQHPPKDLVSVVEENKIIRTVLRDLLAYFRGPQNLIPENLVTRMWNASDFQFTETAKTAMDQRVFEQEQELNHVVYRMLQGWNYPQTTEFDRANEEIRRLRAALVRKEPMDGYHNLSDPKILRSQLLAFWNNKVNDAFDWYKERQKVLQLEKKVAALEQTLVDFGNDNVRRTVFLVTENERMTRQIKNLRLDVQAKEATNILYKGMLKNERDQ